MKFLAISAVLLGLMGVALGAFGAHGLKSYVTSENMEVWKTAVSYQMYHVPVLLLIAGLNPGGIQKLMVWAGWGLLGGILVFSGSLYFLVLLNLPQLGMITPVGGLLLLCGWLLFLLAIVKNRSNF